MFGLSDPAKIEDVDLFSSQETAIHADDSLPPFSAEAPPRPHAINAPDRPTASLARMSHPISEPASPLSVAQDNAYLPHLG